MPDGIKILRQLNGKVFGDEGAGCREKRQKTTQEIEIVKHHLYYVYVELEYPTSHLVFFFTKLSFDLTSFSIFITHNPEILLAMSISVTLITLILCKYNK